MIKAGWAPVCWMEKVSLLFVYKRFSLSVSFLYDMEAPCAEREIPGTQNHLPCTPCVLFNSFGVRKDLVHTLTTSRSLYLCHQKLVLYLVRSLPSMLLMLPRQRGLNSLPIFCTTTHRAMMTTLQTETAVKTCTKRSHTHVSKRIRYAVRKKNRKPSLARSSATICVAKPCQTLYQPVSLFGLQILIKFVLPLTLSATPVKQRGMMLMKKNGEPFLERKTFGLSVHTQAFVCWVLELAIKFHEIVNDPLDR